MAGHIGRLPSGSNKGQKATCHPGRDAWCKRLCQVCYVKSRQRVRLTRAKCHPDRPHCALGLCRNCYRYKKLRDKSPEWRKARNRKHSLRYKFGISQERHDAMLFEQGGVCAICRGDFGNTRWNSPCVDHCHATGQVRGLLCFRCNSGLGYYEKYGAEFSVYLAKHRNREGEAVA